MILLSQELKQAISDEVIDTLKGIYGENLSEQAFKTIGVVQVVLDKVERNLFQKHIEDMANSLQKKRIETTKSLLKNKYPNVDPLMAKATLMYPIGTKFRELEHDSLQTIQTEVFEFNFDTQLGQAYICYRPSSIGHPGFVVYSRNKDGKEQWADIILEEESKEMQDHIEDAMSKIKSEDLDKLVEIATMRYPEGSVVKDLDSDLSFTILYKNNIRQFIGPVVDKIIYEAPNDPNSRFCTLYRNGKWAEILTVDKYQQEIDFETKLQGLSIQEALRERAKKRYPIGTKVQNLASGNDLDNVVLGHDVEWKEDDDSTQVWFKGRVINLLVHEKGKWAKIIKE